MSTQPRPIPEGMHSLTPHLVCDGAAAAIDFYKALGATPMDEWTVFRLSGPALARLGAAASISAPAP